MSNKVKWIDHSYIQDQTKHIYGEGGYLFTPEQNNLFSAKYNKGISDNTYKPVVVQICYQDIHILSITNLHHMIQNMDHQQRKEFIIQREFHYFQTYQEAEDFAESLIHDNYLKPYKHQSIEWDY